MKLIDQLLKRANFACSFVGGEPTSKSVRDFMCLRQIGVPMMVAIAAMELANAASIQPDLRVMDFARAADAVSIRRFEQAGFALETRLSSGASGQFIIRNPGPGLLNLSGVNTIPYNGTQYIAPFTSSIASLWNLSAQPFVLKSIDVAEYSATPNLVTMLRVTGTKIGGATLVATYNINRSVLGQIGDFQTLTFNDDWSSLERLTIAASDSNFRFFNGFSLDNIVLEVIPEPSTGMLAASLVCLLAARRRR